MPPQSSRVGLSSGVLPRDMVAAGWQKLHGSTDGTRRKVWTWTKILSPNIRYFVAYYDLLQFTHFLEIFGQKNAFLGQK